MEYRCVTTSVEGFVQQLAVAYVTHGYWFYVAGEIPQGKDANAVDRKLVERYGIAITKWARARRKKQGLANMQYLRYERTFVLLATKGRHEFFERERPAIRDIRRVPIKFAGYSIGCRNGRDRRWHASVRIERSRHEELKAFWVQTALRGDGGAVAEKSLVASLQPFAPVKRQLYEILRAINRVRCVAGMPPVSVEAASWRRRVVRPFRRN